MPPSAVAKAEKEDIPAPSELREEKHCLKQAKTELGLKNEHLYVKYIPNEARITRVGTPQSASLIMKIIKNSPSTRQIYAESRAKIKENLQKLLKRGKNIGKIMSNNCRRFIMAVEMFFREVKKGYDKEEVHAFVEKLRAGHEIELERRDDEIKTLTTENQRIRETLEARIAELELLLADEQARNAEGAAKYEQLCAQIGEKLLFAENQASAIIADAESNKLAIEGEARQRADAAVAEIIARAKEQAAASLRAADVLAQKSRIINAALEQTKRIIDDAIAQIGKAAN